MLPIVIGFTFQLMFIKDDKANVKIELVDQNKTTQLPD